MWGWMVGPAVGTIYSDVFELILYPCPGVLKREINETKDFMADMLVVLSSSRRSIYSRV